MTRQQPARRRALTAREQRALAGSRGRHRQARRRGRAAVLGLALSVTLVAAGAAVGVIPSPGDGDNAAAVVADSAATSLQTAALPVVVDPTPARKAVSQQGRTTSALAQSTATPDLPPGSGTGRRIVFDQSDQRVWLVGADGDVERSYLVSGSIHDNLQPGTYAVQMKQRHATAYDYSSTMEYFIQFTHGQNAAIGFHSVPRAHDGSLEQTKDQLGTPLSAGCVRQWLPDAKRLWSWAEIGTTVVVTA